LNYLLAGCVRREHIRSDSESDLNSQNRAFANRLKNRGGTLVEGKNLNVFNGDDLPFNV